MTVKELKEELKNLNEDLEVKIRFPSPDFNPYNVSENSVSSAIYDRDKYNKNKRIVVLLWDE